MNSQVRKYHPVFWIAAIAAIVVLIFAVVYFDLTRKIVTLAEQAESEKRFADQAGYLTDLAGREPWRKEYLLEIANAYFLSGDFVKAVLWYEKSIHVKPLVFEDKFRYGRALHELEKVDTVGLVFRELGSLPGRTNDEYYQLVLSQRIIRDLEGAISTLKTWEKENNPTEPRLFYQLGLIQAVLDPDSAKIPLLATSGMSPDFRTQLAPLLQILESTELNEDDRMFQTGQALFDLRELDLAEIVFNQAVETSPGNWDAWAMLGQTRQMEGKDGYADLVKALELNPQSRLARYFLAVYWREHGQVEISNKYLTHLSEEEPAESLWQVEQGKTAYSAGDISASFEHFQAATVLDPFNVTNWQILAEFCIGNGIDVDGVGESAVQKAVLLAPKDPISNDLMGWLLLTRSDFDNAAKFLRVAIEGDPAFARSRLHYGQALHGLGELESAREQLRNAIALDPSGVVGLTAGRLLKQNYRDE